MTPVSATADDPRRGAILVERGILTPAQLETALQLEKEHGRPLAEIVTVEFGVPHAQLSQILDGRWAQLDPDSCVDAHYTTPSHQGSTPAAAPNDTPLRMPHQAIPSAAAPNDTPLRMGEVLVGLSLVSHEDLEAALAIQEQKGGRLGEILVQRGVISRIELAGALAEHWSSLARRQGEVAGSGFQSVAATAAAPYELESLLARVEGLRADLVEGAAARDEVLSERLDRLSTRLDEVVSTAPAELMAQLESLTEERHRSAGVLDQLAADVVALGEQADAHREAMIGAESGQELVKAGELESLLARVEGLRADLVEGAAARDEVLSERLDRLSTRLDEVVSTAPAELMAQLESLTEERHRSAGVLDQLAADVVALGEQADAHREAMIGAESGQELVKAGELESLLARVEGLRADLVEGAAARDEVLSERLDRLSTRLDEVVSTAPAELMAQLESLTEERHRSAGVLDQLAADVVALGEQADAHREAMIGAESGQELVKAGELESLLARVEGLRADLVEGAAARDEVLSERLDRLSTRLDEVVSTAPAELMAQLESLTEERHRSAGVLDQLAADVVALGEQADAHREAMIGAESGQELVKAGELESLLARVEGLRADLVEGAAARDEVLSERLDRLSTRLDEVVSTAPAELMAQLESLTEERHRSAGVLDQLAADVVALGEQADAHREAMIGAESGQELVKAGELESLLARVEGLRADLVEGAAARDEVLSERLDRLSTRLDEVVSTAPAELMAQLESLSDRFERVERSAEDDRVRRESFESAVDWRLELLGAAISREFVAVTTEDTGHRESGNDPSRGSKKPKKSQRKRDDDGGQGGSKRRRHRQTGK